MIAVRVDDGRMQPRVAAHHESVTVDFDARAERAQVLAPGVERAASGRRASETEIDLLELLAPRVAEES